MIFGLIHGGMHSGRCWSKLVPELEALGHTAITVDLPIEDPTADLAAYTDVACAAFAGADPLVVVGHSLGGATALEVSARLHPAGTIMLCSAINFSPETNPTVPVPVVLIPPEATPLDDSGVVHMSAADARTYFYSDCPPEVTEAAIADLRGQAVAGMGGPVTATRIANPSVFVRATEDRSVDVAWQQWAAQTLTGREPVLIPGSHSPFLTRPAELADLFDQLAAEFAAAG